MNSMKRLGVAAVLAVGAMLFASTPARAENWGAVQLTNTGDEPAAVGIVITFPSVTFSDFRTFELGVVRMDKTGNVPVILQAAQLPQVPGVALPDVSRLSLTLTDAPATSKPLDVQSTAGNKTAKTVTLSVSSEEGGHPADHAFDGSTKTRWCAGSDALAEWLRFDFDDPKAIGGMEADWEFPDKEYGYVIEGTVDGKAWKELAKTTNKAAERRTKLSGTYNSLRIKVTSLPEDKWASISEVRIFDNMGKAI
jgi:hypothetical protein